MYKTSSLNYSICNSMKKFLQLHSRIKNKHDDGSDVCFTYLTFFKKYFDWLLSLNMFYISVVHHWNKIILLLKYICVEFISIKLLWENQVKGIGGCKKKEKISKSKTPTLAFFDNLKMKQQVQGDKNWCSTASFM